MLHKIQSFLGYGRKKPLNVPVVGESRDLELESIPRYPPFMKGLPNYPAAELLTTQAELMGRIRLLLGMGDEQYEKIVLPVITRYAQFVHLLPASEAHHHRGAGGLLRHGLEVGFWSGQFSLGHVFPHDGPLKDKRPHEMRWLFAAFVSGLTHDLGKPLSDMEITTAQGESVWSPYKESLETWACGVRAERYFVRWRNSRVHKRHEAFTLMMFKNIVGDDAIGFLCEYDARLLPALFSAIGGTTASDPLARIVIRADQESVKRDLLQNRINVDEFSYGVPVEKYVFDAMRSLVKSGEWEVNTAGGAVWVLRDGVFIAWRSAIGLLHKSIEKAGIPGIPRDQDTLADVLIERGYAIGKEVITEDGEVLNYRYWPISAPVANDQMSGEAKILALRLDTPELIFTGEIPPIIDAAKLIDNLTPGAGNSTLQDQGSKSKEDKGAAKTKKKSTKTNAKPALDNGSEGNTLFDASGQALVPTPVPQDESNQTDAESDDDDVLPADFPDMVEALMATEAIPPPMEMAPQKAIDAGDDDAESQSQTKEGTAPGQGTDRDLGSGQNSGQNSALVSQPSMGGEVHEDNKDAAAPVSAAQNEPDGESSNDPAASLPLGTGARPRDTGLKLLGKTSKESLGQSAAFNPLGGSRTNKSGSTATKTDHIVGLPGPKANHSPPATKSKPSKPHKKAATEQTEQTGQFGDIERLFDPYPQEAKGPILKMLLKILSGNGRLGETIDRRATLYCVRNHAFENAEAFDAWKAMAIACRLVSSVQPDDLWESDAVAFSGDLQEPLADALRVYEMALDPFAQAGGPAADLACDGEDGPAHAAHASTREKQPTNKKKMEVIDDLPHQGKRAWVDESAQSSLLDEQTTAVLDEFTKEQTTRQTTKRATSKSEPAAESVQMILNLSQPQGVPKIDDVFVMLAKMMREKTGDWLADMRVESDGVSIDMSRTFDRVLADGQCTFTKSALRMAIKKSDDLAISRGRIMLSIRR